MEMEVFKYRKPFETFAHYRIGKGHATLSISVDEGAVQVGVCFCHPRDNFNKGFGREVAAGRRAKASNEFSFEFQRKPGMRLTDQVRAEFEGFVLDSAVPRRLLEAGETVEWTGAPPWAIHSLTRELRRRARITVN